jgi:hypothetical protein
VGNHQVRMALQGRVEDSVKGSVGRPLKPAQMPTTSIHHSPKNEEEIEKILSRWQDAVMRRNRVRLPYKDDEDYILE